MTWRKLAEASLMRIQLFNRRRVGEMAILVITPYEQKHDITAKDELFKSLSEEDVMVTNEYVRIAHCNT